MGTNLISQSRQIRAVIVIVEPMREATAMSAMSMFSWFAMAGSAPSGYQRATFLASKLNCLFPSIDVAFRVGEAKDRSRLSGPVVAVVLRN